MTRLPRNGRRNQDQIARRYRGVAPTFKHSVRERVCSVLAEVTIGYRWCLIGACQVRRLFPRHGIAARREICRQAVGPDQVPGADRDECVPAPAIIFSICCTHAALRLTIRVS